MPFEPEHDDQKMAEELRLPAGQQFDFRIPWPADSLPGGQGYMLAHWGIRTDWDIARDGEPPWPFTSAPVSNSFEWITDEGGTRTPRLIFTVRVFHLWLVQAYRPGHPLAAERRWHPGYGVRDSLVGLEEPHDRIDLLAAWTGQRLIVGDQEQTSMEVGRSIDLRLAVQAARILVQTGPVTREAIFELIEKDQPGLSLDALLKRWGRRKPPIRMREIMEVAASK